MPDDPSQVVYVSWDALGNYVTSLGYGTECFCEGGYQQMLDFKPVAGKADTLAGRECGGTCPAHGPQEVKTAPPPS